VTLRVQRAAASLAGQMNAAYTAACETGGIFQAADTAVQKVEQQLCTVSADVAGAYA
jgi:uncharacterized lipoprotein YajG